MAILIRQLSIAFCLFFSFSVIGHTIYAPNDIPLLDNRFRIDPETDEVTFIFSHSKGYQRVVLVQPDGSKLYQQRHPENIAWVSSKVQDMVTVQNPMPGPWQAIAELDGDNRIKIISKVNLKTNNFPLKMYAKEFITTHAALYEGDKLITNPAYINDTKLSVSLIGKANKKMTLYLDDGKNYDQLAFDGELTAHLYVDLQPGRYLMSVRTQNDVFVRNVNKDAVIFPSPIKYNISALEPGSDEAKITFIIDGDEIALNSVSIDGVLKDSDNKINTKVLMHSIDNPTNVEQFSSTYKLEHKIYTFSGKVFATTLKGREIELQLPERIFELIPPFIMPEINESEALATQEGQTTIIEAPAAQSLLSNIWVVIAIATIFLLIIAAIGFFLWKLKKNKSKVAKSSIDELNVEGLEPMPIDVKDVK